MPIDVSIPQPTSADSARTSLARTNITIEGNGLRLSFQVAVPAGPTTASTLLPIARALSDAIVGETCKGIEAAGEKISCAAGCGACCRSLVAISEVEARRIRMVIAALEPGHRSAVEGRFADARHRLKGAGFLEALHEASRWTEAEYKSMLGLYFSLGIPCPFLEDESCSIYAERPLTCREFLVTSPPAHCAKSGSEGVRQVRLPLRVSNALARLQTHSEGAFVERWVPLVLAPDWAESHPKDEPPKPGLELLRELLEGVNRQE